MRKIITRIILDFHNDLDIFTEDTGHLHATLQDLDNKAVVRSRNTPARQPEGKEKLKLARQCADSQIEATVSNHTIPGAIRQMLGDVWRDKLVFIYLREPDADQSNSWELATQTIESILWCVEPRSTTEERASLQEHA